MFESAIEYVLRRLLFGAAPELDRYLAALTSRTEADNVKFVILRLKRVRHPSYASNASSISCASKARTA